MATTSTPGPVRHDLWEARPFIIDPTVSNGAGLGYYNVGDMAYWTGAGAASFGNGPITLSTAVLQNLQKRLGFFKDAWPMSGGIQSSIVPKYAGIYPYGTWQRKTTSGDTYTHLSPVTIGADAQTVQLAANAAPIAPGSTAVASGTGGTWSATAHSIAYSWNTIIGETFVGPATSLTLTSGQNIVVTLTSGYLPSYVLGLYVYVDGVCAGYITSTGAVTLTGPLTGITAGKVAPLESALTIGYVDLQLPTGNNAYATVAGGASATVNVRMLEAYPHAGLI